MTEKNQTQQAFLKAAKGSLGMTWDQLAEATGIVPRTFKNYRLPDGSKNHRTLPHLAREAVQRLLDDKANKPTPKPDSGV